MKLQQTQNQFSLLFFLLLFLYSTSVFPCSKTFSNTDYLPIEKAQALVRKLKIRTLHELKKQKEINDRLKKVPINPDIIYKDEGWISFTDFFGTTHEWNLYRKTKAYSEELDLQNTVFSNSYRSDSLAINYWVIIDHIFQYLVHDKSVTWKHITYEDSQAIVQKLNIKTMDELRNRRKEIRLKLNRKDKTSTYEHALLYYVPANPRQFYKDQSWQSNGDFFAKEEWLPVDEVQDLVQELGIKSVFELWNRRKTDDRLQNIPSHPGQIYNSGWKDYPTFFDLKNVPISQEQIRRVKKEHRVFLQLVYSIANQLRDVLFPITQDQKEMIVYEHIHKLAIEKALEKPIEKKQPTIVRSVGRFLDTFAPRFLTPDKGIHRSEHDQ